MKKKENTLKKINKPRIAIVCGSMNIGGGETMAAKLAGYIDKNKFDVKYFVISKYIDNQIAKELQISGTVFECLNLPNNFSWHSYKKFSKAINSFNPHVIHCHLDVSYSWIWSLLHNRPLITTMHSDPYRRRDKRVSILIKLKALQGNLRVICCSKKTMELTTSCYGLKNKYMGCIYNPISIDNFKPHEHIDNQADLVAVGRLHEVKNYPLMLRAFKIIVKRCPNAKLSIAGTGPLEAELKSLTEELNLQGRVTFLGNVSDIPTLLSQKSMLLLSSLSEACPMVILEAMAAGLPIVATNVGGVPEIVTNNGIVVESEDVNAFTEAVLKVVLDTELMKCMSQNSFNNAARFDKTVIAREYEDEYIKLAKWGSTE